MCGVVALWPRSDHLALVGQGRCPNGRRSNADMIREELETRPNATLCCWDAAAASTTIASTTTIAVTTTTTLPFRSSHLSAGAPRRDEILAHLAQVTGVSFQDLTKIRNVGIKILGAQSVSANWLSTV